MLENTQTQSIDIALLEDSLKPVSRSVHFVLNFEERSDAGINGFRKYSFLGECNETAYCSPFLLQNTSLWEKKLVYNKTSIIKDELQRLFFLDLGQKWFVVVVFIVVVF